MYKLSKIVLFVLIACSSNAQELLINSIYFEGNRKTTTKAIYRELDIRAGDSLQLIEINQVFEKNKYQLLSTGLFNSVVINLRNYNPEKKTADIQISFEENWYLFPVPIFELADRNFNVWWTEENRSLSRLNYGVRLLHYNLSGNRDPLKVKVQFGFTRKFEIKYERPNLTKDNKWGFASTLFYSDNKTIAYSTIANKTLWHKNENEDVLLKRLRFGPEIKYRPSVHHFHGLRLEYHHNRIDDYVIENLNENYFLNRSNSLQMLYLEYDFNWDRRQYILYPNKGQLFFLNLKKEGLGIFNDVNIFNINLGGEYYAPIGPFVFGTRLRLKTNLNREPLAFANNTGLGWDEDIVGGYELYVLDGSDFFYNSNRLTWKIFENNLRTSEKLPVQFQHMHLSIFLRLNFDLAIVNERRFVDTNSLNNRWIYGYGPALDIIVFNNFLISFEYSKNDIGEKGLYISNKIGF